MAVSIAITSGKGGVGKTNTAVNLAISLGRLGKRVLLFDADFGLANTHILLGINAKKTIAEFLNGSVPLESTLTEVATGVKMIAGGSGLLELLNLDDQARYKVLTSLSYLEDEIDYLIVDCQLGHRTASFL